MNCPGCCMSMKEPFVRCLECQSDLRLCLNVRMCFSKGAEFAQHSNDHSYEIKHMAFPLFDDNHALDDDNKTHGNEGQWTARNEVLLLDEMEDKGYGNWQEICKQLNNKKSKDVEEHFVKHYVNGPISIKQVNIKSQPFWRRPISFTGSSVPPRPDGVDMDDMLYMIGYMPARGDFVVEHDNFAESDLKDVEFNGNKNNNNTSGQEDCLIREMNLAMVDVYYTRQRERRARKRLVKRYGLLDLCSSASALITHSREERLLRDLFSKLMQLMKPEEHEKLLRSILYQKYLEKRIERLQEHRKLGLKYFRDATIFEKLKCKRDRIKKTNVTKLDEVLLHTENPYACQVWLQRQFTSKRSSSLPQLPQTVRKSLPPLDIAGLPSSDFLNEDEKKLCSNNRISPEDYLSYRSILQQESFQENGVKLQTARTLLKIDVNKTKKLYEFLVQKGLIKTLT